ncbi:WXG100-like domain-containing protein [Nocardia mexicana]|uniref:Outer membrane channel protein CpnT-like N-terminal domain-containing protein n=1 Tax=Nocardia mexicana TaxID=279262 RepID=A0A370GMG3_9NOCA|nr:hypothetical protein [Nocardia mexicana]RDI43604.1 hypothetical protein DFR68_12071 [Nocardia mexicana]
MSLYLPPELRWLGWVAGAEWPDGDEDALFGVAEAWEEAAAAVRELTDELLIAREATGSAYSAGQGADAMAALFDQLITGDQSVAALAESMQQVSDGAFDTATQIEAAKLMIIISLVTLAIEIFWAWRFPPTAPVAQAAAIAATRSWIRLLTDRIVGLIARIAESVMSKAAAKVFGTYTMRAVEGVAVATGLDLLVQGIQIAKGHRKHIDGTQVGISAVAGGLGSVASRFTANYTGKAFDKYGGAALNKFAGKEIGDVRGMPFARGVTVGAMAGLSSTLTGNFVSGAWTGDWAGSFGGPHGYVGGAGRSALVGGVRGGFTARQLSPSAKNPLNPVSYGRTFRGQSMLPGPVRKALGMTEMSPGGDGAARYSRETAEAQSRQARQAQDHSNFRREEANQARRTADELRHLDGAELRAHEANVTAGIKEQRAVQADERTQALQDRAERAQQVADEQARLVQDRPKQAATDAQNTADQRRQEAAVAGTQADRDTAAAGDARAEADRRVRAWNDLNDRATAQERNAAAARTDADSLERKVADIDGRTRALDAEDPRRPRMEREQREAEQEAAGAREQARVLEENVGRARDREPTAKGHAVAADRHARDLENRAALSNRRAVEVGRDADKAQAIADRRQEQAQQLRDQLAQRRIEEQRAQAAIEQRDGAAEYERRAVAAEQRARRAEEAYRAAPPGTPEEQLIRNLRETAIDRRRMADQHAEQQRAEQQARIDAVERPKRAAELRAEADRKDRAAEAAHTAGDDATAQRLRLEADNLRDVAADHEERGRQAAQQVDEYGRAPESVLADATDLKAKARPKRVTPQITMPGRFAAPTAPDAQVWLGGDGSTPKPSKPRS